MAFDRFESVQESILDECVCMVQLLVYQRILGEIAS
jgi:hypothetical protein